MSVKTHRNCPSGCMKKWRDKVDKVEMPSILEEELIMDNVSYREQDLPNIRGIGAGKSRLVNKGTFNGRNLAEYRKLKVGPKPTYRFTGGYLIRSAPGYDASSPQVQSNGDIIIPINRNIPTLVRIKKKNFFVTTNLERYHHRGVAALRVRKRNLQNLVILQHPENLNSHDRSLLVIPSSGQPTTNARVRKNILSLI